jgi:hypothetical protein
MEKVVALVFALLFTMPVSPAIARGHNYSNSYRSYSYSNHYYTNVSGHRVHSPVFSGVRPAGATAHCGDGSWSFSEHARGTCSHHGGVQAQ